MALPNRLISKALTSMQSQESRKAQTINRIPLADERGKVSIILPDTCVCQGVCVEILVCSRSRPCCRQDSAEDAH
jgi:hypothetical protein